jgi:serine/threonine protein kinase
MSLCINPQCPKPDNSDTSLFCEACGSELLLKGRYRAMCKLGEGGFGITYEVTKVGSNVPEVLKVLTYDEPKAIELFQQEAKVLSELDHPGIPKVERDSYFVYHSKGSKVPIHCFVMEKIVGMDLDRYMKNREQRPIDQKLAIEWLKELVTILGKVHDKKFFHRDIKPPNIMIRSSGELVLIDFGTAREITQTVLQQKGYVTKIESEGYSPQEQLEYNAIPQSDFFALGRTFVALLTGKEPHTLYDSFHRELRWRNHAPEISPLLANLMDKMMAHKPSQRPANTQAILQRLSKIESELYHPKQAYPTPKPSPSVVNSSESDINIGQIIHTTLLVLVISLLSAYSIFVSLFWGYFTLYYGSLIGAVIAICLALLLKSTDNELIGLGILISLFILFIIPLASFNPRISIIFLFHSPPFISTIDHLLAFSSASIVSALILTSCVTPLWMITVDEARFNSYYNIESFIIANISFCVAIIAMFITIDILEFQSLAIVFITATIVFFTVEGIFQYLVLKYSLSQTRWTFLTGSFATLIGGYISFNLLDKLIISHSFKTIIGLSISSIICVSVYAIRTKIWDQLSIFQHERHNGTNL